ncbi:MAG: hypothetical protein IAE82_18985, partial [Opitutaceae bacterium]|nr:hypothetical protein [Opitutaceae bacterium]
MISRARFRTCRMRRLVAIASVTIAGGWVTASDGPEATGLYAPVALEVVDVDATVAIAIKAGEHTPIVLAHDPGIALAVVESFDAAFVQTRAAFLARLQATLGAPVLDAAAVGEQAFRDFRADFQEDNPLFPVSPALAQSWARGFDGEPVRERIAGLLRAFEREQLIGAIRPASSAFVVPPGAGDGARTWGEVASRARAVEPATVLTPSAAGELLRRMSDPLDRAAGGYLSGLLRENVAEDRYLTGLLLRERLGAAVVQRTIGCGTKLSEAGRPVDPWAALALEHMRRLGIQPVDTMRVDEAPRQPGRAETESSLDSGDGSGGWGRLAGASVLVLGIAGAGLIL